MDIVILDDEPVAIALLKHHVGRVSDCTPIPFTHPLTCLEWCATHMPDMVIVDFMMPGMNGVEFTERFRAMEGHSDIPMLMVTASSDRETRLSALEAGINDFVSKPFDAVELTARMKNMLALRASQKNLAQRAQMLADEAFATGQFVLEIAARERETLLCLGLAAERRDPETAEHITRMSNYSKLIGIEMGLGSEEAEMLLLASPLHDVGKLGTPDHILLKKGQLTPAEWDIMKQHTVIGAEILSQSKSPILQLGAKIAISHHEKFDGSGYPYGLKGDAIPLYGRIVALADVFDALTSARPYKPAWEVDRALAFIRQHTGNHFDPSCVAAFMQALDQVLEIKARFQDAPIEHPEMAAA